MTKQLGRLLLTLVMALGLTAAANAAGPHTVIINSLESGHTYTAYQIFSGTAFGETLTNIEWGDGFDHSTFMEGINSIGIDSLGSLTQNSSADELASALKSCNTAQLDVFASEVGKFLKDSAGTSTETQTGTLYAYTISGLSDGYYLIADGSAKYILLPVTGDVTITPKSEVPTLSNALESGSATVTTQDVGSDIPFTLTSKVPAMDGYSSYTFTVNGTLTAGLTFDASKVSVQIGGNYYTDTSVTQNGQTFTITFNNFIDQEENAGQDMTITYSASLNENALTRAMETSTVSLTYSNDPYNDDSTGTTPAQAVNIYDFDLVVDSYDSNNTKLSGAQFVLYKTVSGTKQYYACDTTTKKVSWVTDQNSATTVTTDANGAAKFQGLAAGTYTLQETAAPAGYNCAKPENVPITATFDKNGTLASSSAKSTNNGQYQQTVQVKHSARTKLPSTGGQGTGIFYLLGGALALGAGVLLLVRLRQGR